MRGFARIAAAVAIFLCCYASAPAMAQPTSQAPSPPVAGQLDTAGLQAMLEGLGYETKALSKGYLVTIKQGTFTLYVQLLLSPDATKLGMNANLGEVANLDVVPAKKWLDMLVLNGSIDPSSFYVDRENKKVYLHRSIDNRGMTPLILRTQLENFSNNVVNSADTWDMTK
jgi:hypothetical protein